jgi:arginyl-tRNA synthetase
MIVRPLPVDKGVGFFTMEAIKDHLGYRYETLGRYHNYYFTANNWRWPVPFYDNGDIRTVDGFSPNLNKELHIGHLRNLAVANALSKMHPRWYFVALLGASQGVYKTAVNNLNKWFTFLDYNPEVFFDVLMPRDKNIVPRKEGTGDHTGCLVWTEKDIVLFRSEPVIDLRAIPEDKRDKFHELLKDTNLIRAGDVYVIPAQVGSPTYSFHDLAFAATKRPDYYITGQEQIQHFRDLGLGEKHLPMGLVMGKDGTKLKSRTGDAMSAEEAMEMIKSRLDKTTDPDKLAWNIVCWNFLHCSRVKNVIFDPEKWTSPESPGLYITYTYARLSSAIKKAADCGQNVLGHYALESMWEKISELDLQILGWAEYHHHWFERTAQSQDMAALAGYVHDLSRVLGGVYNKDRIIGGRDTFFYSIIRATDTLAKCMKRLGMFCLEEV